jgi:hypothetical protein
MHTLHRASHTRGSFLFSKRKDDFSMQLVIAEKASVGFALAKALGVRAVNVSAALISLYAQSRQHYP